MKAARLYITIEKLREYRSLLKVLFSCWLVIFCVVFTAFVSTSVNRFVSGTMSIAFTLPNTDVLAEKTRDNSPIEVSVKKGDTLLGILSSQGYSHKESNAILATLKKLSDVNTLSVGQKVIFDYDMSYYEDGDDADSHDFGITSPDQITIEINDSRHIELTRDAKNTWIAKDNTIAAVTHHQVRHHAVTYVMNGSFTSAAKSLGIKPKEISEIVNAYRYQLDFQRQIRSGDKVTFVIEKFFKDSGQFSHDGKVLSVSMNLSGKEYNIYKYTPKGSNAAQYYLDNGRSVKRNLLRTPVSVAKVSSHFGNRKDPILGFTKMHTGVDFKARHGAPIYAAGNGVVTEMGWRSGYGNFIQVKHSSRLYTAYAHASKFATGVSKGSQVKQGQIIAYVGQTGRATAPHLHYEIKIDGKHVDPMSVKLAPGTELSAYDLNKFKKFQQEMNLVRKSNRTSKA